MLLAKILLIVLVHILTNMFCYLQSFINWWWDKGCHLIPCLSFTFSYWKNGVILERLCVTWFFVIRNYGSFLTIKMTRTYASETQALCIHPGGTCRIYNVASTSMQGHDVASTFWRRCIYGMYPLDRYFVAIRLCFRKEILFILFIRTESKE